jgi:hypothetical protein
MRKAILVSAVVVAVIGCSTPPRLVEQRPVWPGVQTWEKLWECPPPGGVVRFVNNGDMGVEMKIDSVRVLWKDGDTLYVNDGGPAIRLRHSQWSPIEYHCGGR